MPCPDRNSTSLKDITALFMSYRADDLHRATRAVSDSKAEAMQLDDCGCLA